MKKSVGVNEVLYNISCSRLVIYHFTNCLLTDVCPFAASQSGESRNYKVSTET